MKLSLRFMAVALILTLGLSLFGCGGYDEDFVMGKTSQEIIERYGDFDYLEYSDVDGYSEEGGLYRNCKTGYVTKTEKGEAVEYFAISFDENGIAYKVEKNYTGPEN